MAEIKATSFRIIDEDGEKFKQFMEKEGLKTQAEGFKAVMQAVEVAKAKNAIKDRGKEIETFQDTVNKLVGYYLNSLEVNQNSEERIREELSKELQTKDDTISTMFEQLQELKADKINSDNNLKDINSKNKELLEQLQKANTDITDKQKNIDKLNSNNDLLQENLKEYKQYKDNYKKLEDEFAQLKADHQVLKDNNNKLNNDNKQLHDKLNNNTDMITFYKSEIDNKDKSINEYKADIKVLEDTHKQQVLDVKDLYKSTLDSKFKEYQEQLKKSELEFKEKLAFELQKKDLEFQKLKNEIDNLKKSNLKTSTPKTK